MLGAMNVRHGLLLVATMVAAGCGGGGSPSTTPLPSPTPTPTPTPGGTITGTFTGTARYRAGGCSSSGHDLSVGEGTIAVTLVQATAASVQLQVCHPTAVNHATECTIPPFASLMVGATVSATLRGGRAQTVTVYPDPCGRPGTFPDTEVTYTINVAYPQ
jgi:hypothetical protein